MSVASCAKNSFEELEKFGKFQIIQYLLICLPLMVVAMINVNYIFIAGHVGYRCRVPDCDNQNSTYHKPLWWPQNIDEKCRKPVYTTADSKCNASFVEQSELCQEWIYEDDSSIISELNLACQPWKINLIGSIHNSGMIISMSLMGWISDKFGRKPCLILCSVGGIVGLIKLFLKNYYAYITMEFIESVISSGLYTVAVVMMVEIGGRTKRVLAGVIFSYGTYLGEFVFAFVAYLAPHWKYIIIIIYSPTIIFVFYQLILKESVRWQMMRGKMVEAKNTLSFIAQMNKIDITAKEIANISDDELRKKFEVENQNQKENLKELIASKQIMIRLIVTSFCFFSAGFVYYGLMVQSVFLPGDKYVNFTLGTMTSFPGDFLALITFNRYGRKISLQCGFFACAVFLMAQYYVPETMPWLQIVFYLGGKLVITLCFTGMYTYSMELFPTSVRGSLVGCGNTASRIGSMLSPLTLLVLTDSPAVPAYLFVSSSTMAMILLSFTPETKKLPLFDTIAQIENYKYKE